MKVEAMLDIAGLGASKYRMPDYSDLQTRLGSPRLMPSPFKTRPRLDDLICDKPDARLPVCNAGATRHLTTWKRRG